MLNLSEKNDIQNEINSKLIENEKMDALQNELLITKDNLSKITINNVFEKNTQLNDAIIMNNKSIDEINILLKNQSTNKSNVRGAKGETYFLNLALNTFSDFETFEIIEKTKSPHCGDFWLKFDKFTIMVDSKNYVDTPVPSRDRVKLKNDIQYNKNIKIAWLVSMDQPILTFLSFLTAKEN